MKTSDQKLTKEQLIKELKKLRGKISKLKKKEAALKKSEKTLLESEEKYKTLVNSTEDSIYQVNRDYEYLFMNKKHFSRLKLSKARLGEKAYSDFHTPVETEKFKDKVNKAFKTGKSTQYEYKSQRDNRYFLQTFSPVKNRDRKTISVTVISKDITSRKMAQEALEDSEKRFRALFNQASDSIFLLKPTDKGLIIMDMNDVACRIHDYTYKELIGEPMAFLDEQKARKHVGEGINQLMKGETLTFETRHVRKDGSAFPIEVSAQLIEIGSEPYVLAIDRDISERKRMEEELRSLSLTDDLTGLHNRRGCLTLGEQLLKIAAREKRKVLILYADVDNLKEINDRFGHKGGDQALMDIADVLKENYRGSDVVARIGGDEFVVVPVGTSVGNEDIIANRFQNELNNYILKKNRRYSVSVSVGIAYFDPDNPYPMEVLLDKADKLMYKQKKLKKKKK